MGDDALDLNALCDELLAASIEALDMLPGMDPALEGAPDRAFVSPGQPALDCCDQLAVWVNQITEEPAPQARGFSDKDGRVNLVGLVVTIGRCVPTFTPDGQPPDTEDLAAAAAQTNADAWVLWNHLWNLKRSGELFTMCGKVFWDGMRPIQNSGGCGGWNLSIRVGFDGYEDVASS